MGKGLGAIFAEGKMALDELNAQDGVKCPVCGRNFSFNGCVWSHSDYTYEDENLELPDDLKAAIRREGYNPYAYYFHDDAVEQLAAIIIDDEIAFELVPANGHGRFGGWMVRSVGDYDVAQVPNLVQQHGWTWWEWVPDRFEEKRSFERPTRRE